MFPMGRFRRPGVDRHQSIPLDRLGVPGWGSPGQTVQITVVVENMALVQGQTLASLGDGISVQNAPVGAYGPVQVIAPNQAQITAIISPAAPSGARTLYLKTGSQVAQGTFTVW